MGNEQQRVDVLAVMDRLIKDRKENPRAGDYYPAALLNGVHAVMHLRKGGLGGRALEGVEVETRETEDAAEAECDRLNGYAAARAAVAELIEAVIENRKATQEFANDGRPENYFAWDASERRVQKALANVGAQP